MARPAQVSERHAGAGQGSRGHREVFAQAHPESRGEVILVALAWPPWGATQRQGPRCWPFRPGLTVDRGVQASSARPCAAEGPVGNS